MKALKTTGLVLLVMWMAFITYAVEGAVRASNVACGFAWAAMGAAMGYADPDARVFCPDKVTGVF